MNANKPSAQDIKATVEKLKLTPLQKKHIIAGRGSVGRLVTKGIYTYVWGTDPSFGFRITKLGSVVKKYLIEQESGIDNGQD